MMPTAGQAVLTLIWIGSGNWRIQEPNLEWATPPIGHAPFDHAPLVRSLYLSSLFVYSLLFTGE